MVRYLKFLFLSMLLLQPIVTSLQAQTIIPKFDKVTVAIPNCVLQDANGFIWIGAQEGLLRYDGYNLKKYSNAPFDSTSLSANWVTTLAEDKMGNLWVGTLGGGLNYFKQITEQFTHFNLISKNDSAISSNSISKIIANKDGSLWIGTTDCGVFHAKIGSTKKPEITHYNLINHLNLKTTDEKIGILDLYSDANDCLWIGTKIHGLIKLDPRTDEIIHFVHDPENPASLSHNSVNSICADSLGNIWIATGEETIGSGGGLNMYDRQTGQFIHFRHNPGDPASLLSDRVYPLLIDSKGVLWMGFPGKGMTSIPVSELVNNKKPDFRKSQRYRLYSVHSIYEDHTGNIWLSQFGWNLYKYDRHQNPFSWYHRVLENSNTMSSSGIECLYIDRSQNIWFGYHSTGLDKYNPRTGLYRHYSPRPNDPDYLNAKWITGIYQDSSGIFWIATMGKGLFLMDPVKESFQHYRSKPGGKQGLPSDLIALMLLSKTGNLWISSMDKGLLLFEPDRNQSRHIDIDSNSLEDEKITSMLEDQDGTVWLGTIDDGLYGIQVNNDEIETMQHYVHNQANRNSLSYNNIVDIIRPTILDTNALWIATANGLNRFDLQTESFTHFFEKDGIPDNLVLKVLEDNLGNIWIACAIGLGMYDIKTDQWKSYGTSDGMPFETFGGARQNTAKGADGQLFFSGASGTIGFYPEKIKDNKFIPPIRLTDFKIFNQSVRLDTAVQFKNSITLSYDQNAFSFEFAALNFTNSGKNQYAYKMEGFHDDWIHIGNDRTASFTNLEPGEYVFHVRGSNNDGIWNEQGTSVWIIITPPWWKTWWFRSIVLLLITGAIYGIYRLRLNKILQMERMRVQIASDLHDDIGASLTRIAVHSEIIQSTKDAKNIRKSSSRIGTMSREIITTLSDIVWSIDARNDTMGDLLDRMRDFLDTVFLPGSIKIDFQTKGLHFDQKIAQELRQNIYLIFKEAVNNAARHSGGSEISIRLTNGSGTFFMEVADNGSGFNLQNSTAGHHGLENMRMRAKRIGGTLHIDVGRGTRVTLKTRGL